MCKHLLRQIIHIYIQNTALEKYGDAQTIDSTANRILTTEREPVLATIDQNIIDKMERTYESKYTAKLISKMQRRSAPNKYSLSRMDPQVLATTMQYLKYYEFCSIIPTCSIFVYIQSRYPSLCHYYVNLNQRFWSELMRNCINWSHLQSFKHIKMSCSYGSDYDPSSLWRYGKKKMNQMIIFKTVGDRIFSSSVNTLRTVEIDIKVEDIFSAVPGTCMLKKLMQSQDLTSVTKLFWANDACAESHEQYQWIADNFHRSFPNLQCFMYNHTHWNTSFHANAFKSLMACVQSAVKSATLTRLHLSVYSNYFTQEWNLMERLSELQFLRVLDINFMITCHTCKPIVVVNKVLPLLESLQIGFDVRLYTLRQRAFLTKRGVPATWARDYFMDIMNGLFELSTTIGEFIYRGGVHAPLPAQDWGRLFGQLCSSKGSYARNRDDVRPLQSLVVEPEHPEDYLLILQSMNLLRRSGLYWKLKSLKVATTVTRVQDVSNNLMRTLQNHAWFPFLTHLHIELNGKGLPEESSAYIKAVTGILHAVPSYLVSLKLTFTTKKKSIVLNVVDSKILVNTLWRCLRERTTCKRQDLILNGLRIDRKWGKYLNFMLGANHAVDAGDDGYQSKHFSLSTK